MLAATSPALRADQSAAEALRTLAENLSGQFHGHLLDSMEQDAVEPVHRARVARRRFRAAITAFAPILDEDVADDLQDRARKLFRILGGIRDADVMADRLAGTGKAEDLEDEAGRQRQLARKKLRKQKADGFSDRVQQRLRGKNWRRTGRKAKVLRDAPVAVIATRALDRAWAVALSNGAELATMSPRALHELRKDLKVLRYLSEFFADLWPAAPHDSFLAILRNLQDDLGEVTDLELIRALGHDDGGRGAEPAARAGAHWKDLMAMGPWWQTEAGA